MFWQYSSNQSANFSILLKMDDINISQKIKTRILADSDLKSKIRSKELDHFRVYNREHSEIFDLLNFGNDRNLFFNLFITPESASFWTNNKLQDLGVEFRDVVHFTDLFHNSIESMRTTTAMSSSLSTTAATTETTTSTTIETTKSVDYVRSEKATRLIQLFEHFPSNFQELKNSIEANPSPDEMMAHPISKDIFMIHNYRNHESYVDSLLQHLFLSLGYFDDYMYVCPQFKLELMFGEIVRDAIPDFVICNLNSCYKVACVVDKSDENGYKISSEPQLIAQAIALSQTNVHKELNNNQQLDEQLQPNKKSKFNGDPIYGIRVNGTTFYFYNIPIADSVLQSMKSLEPATNPTEVLRFGKMNTTGLDFFIAQERVLIIDALDCLCQNIKIVFQNNLIRRKL